MPITKHQFLSQSLEHYAPLAVKAQVAEINATKWLHSTGEMKKAITVDTQSTGIESGLMRFSLKAHQRFQDMKKHSRLYNRKFMRLYYLTADQLQLNYQQEAFSALTETLNP
jgi:hypothetical protein